MDSYGSTAPQGEGHSRADDSVGSAASPSAETPLPAPADALVAPADSSPVLDMSAPSSTDSPSPSGRPSGAAAIPAAATPAAAIPAAAIPAEANPAEANPAEASPSHLFGYLAVYSLLRLALVAVLTALLMIFMPLIVALLFAVVIQLPLSWLLFAGPRRRVNEAMARSSAQRRAERDRLQAALSGEEPTA